jgi:hypothetical protein
MDPTMHRAWESRATAIVVVAAPRLLLRYPGLLLLPLRSQLVTTIVEPRLWAKGVTTAAEGRQ